MSALGAFGVKKMVQPEKPPEKSNFEIMENRQDKPQSMIETPDTANTKPPSANDSDLDVLKKAFNGLPQETLPPLKKQDTAPQTQEQTDLHPFLSLDHAKEFVTHIMEGVSKKCVDKIMHLMPDLLPKGTVGISVTDVSTPDEQIFRVRLDQVTTNDEDEKSWQEFFSLYFHPEMETTELIAEPELQDVVPVTTITGESTNLEEKITQYEEQIALARFYLQAGMERTEVRRMIAERTTNEKKSSKR